MKKTLLLIKTGHAETFTENVSSGICSLGDVFRTSILIPLLNDYQVTWLTDQRALPLLRNFKDIHFLTEYSLDDLNHKFDYILNLEKDESFFNLGMTVENFYGLHKREDEIMVKPFLASEEVGLEKINSNNKTFQEKLLTILNCNRKEFDYPKRISSQSTQPKYDIGLNWKVGPKWPEKALEKSFWSGLEKELSPHYKISWQEGFDDLENYMNWIDSCKTIITLDSLGLHLSIAMRKRVVALFGPTDASEIDLYGRGKKFSYKEAHEKTTLLKRVTSYLISKSN